MSEKKPYSRVLAAVDIASDAGDRVLQRALQVSRGEGVTALHVVEGYAFTRDVAFRPAEGLHKQLVEESARRLETVCRRAGVETQAVLLEGHPASQICRYATEHGIDLIVMGGHGRHGWRPLLGSTASGVMHNRACDVYCVHVQKQVQPLQEVLVAVDASEEGREVLSGAVRIAGISDARISLVSVLRPLVQSYTGLDIASIGEAAMRFRCDARAQLTARLDVLGNDFGTSGQRLVREGHPATEIHAAAREHGADLVVIGKHGFSALLGSTANGVLHGAKSDVLAVRVSD